MGQKEGFSHISQLKQEVDAYLRVYSRKTIPVKQLASILRKYSKQQPSIIAETILRSNRNVGRSEVSWDNILEYLQGQVSLKDQVSKIKNIKLSITEASFEFDSRYLQIVQYVAGKQTNAIKQIQRGQINSKEIILVHMNRQILVFDLQTRKIVNHLTYKYSQVKEKMIQRDNCRRQKDQLLQRESQHADKVDLSMMGPLGVDSHIERRHTVTSQQQETKTKKSMSIQLKKHRQPNRSSKSSAFSMKKRTSSQISQLFRRGSLKKPSSVLKYRNNQTNKVFKLFQDATLQNSIQIAKSFIESRETFKNHMNVEKQWMAKDKTQDLYDTSDPRQKRNYQKQLTKMRTFSKFLSEAEKGRARSLKSNTEQSRFTTTKHMMFGRDSYRKNEKKNLFNHLEEKSLEIECFSYVDDYILVGLHSRQVRLYKYKKSIHNYREELIFQKSYEQLPIHVLLYKSRVRKKFNMSVCLSKDQMVKVVVAQLNEDMTLTDIAPFKTTINFSPIFQNLLPLGFAAFSETGWLTVIELNSPFDVKSERKELEKCFSQISFTCIRIHSNGFEYFLGSKEGSIYCIDKYSENVKSKSKVAYCKIMDITFINQDEDILIFTSNFDIKIVNAKNLQVQFYCQYNPSSIQLGKNRLGKTMNKLVLLEPNDLRYGVYSQKALQTFYLFDNQDRKFNSVKPIKLFTSRQKLHLRKGFSTAEKEIKQQSQYGPQNHNSNQLPSQQTACITRWFVGVNSLSILGQNFQLAVYDEMLQYVGSYHNLELDNAVQAVVCRQNKFVAVHYQAGDIQVINIYTQQIVLNLFHPNDELSYMFFAESKDQFLGFLTQKHALFIYSLSGKLYLKLNLQDFHRENLQSIINSDSIRARFYSGKLVSWSSTQKIKNNQQFMKLLIVHHARSFDRNYTINIPTLWISEIGSKELQLSNPKFSAKDNSIHCVLNARKIIKVSLSMKKVQIVFVIEDCLLTKFVDYGVSDKILQFERTEKQKKCLLVSMKSQEVITKINVAIDSEVRFFGDSVLVKDGRQVSVYNSKARPSKVLKLALNKNI